MSRSVLANSILLDIEGTVTPISFVYDVLFPYARLHGPAFIRQHWETESLRAIRAQLWEQNALDRAEGAPRLQNLSPDAEIATVTEYYLWLMERDRKVTPLKTLQGLIWERGFSIGELRSQVFADVPVALGRWREQVRTIAIYSSGSVLAQQQLFGHSDQGNLTRWIDGYFDTRVGGKRERDSYLEIARRLNANPSVILFVSDVLEELDAAKAAGLATALCIRPGNVAITKLHDHQVIRSFDELL
jgi:enolase-phosphatase E1